MASLCDQPCASPGDRRRLAHRLHRQGSSFFGTAIKQALYQPTANPLPPAPFTNREINEGECSPFPFLGEVIRQWLLKPLPPPGIRWQRIAVGKTDKCICFRGGNAEAWFRDEGGEHFPMVLRLLVSPQERRGRKDLVVKLADRLEECFSSSCSAEDDGGGMEHGASVAHGCVSYTQEAGGCISLTLTSLLTDARSDRVFATPIECWARQGGGGAMPLTPPRLRVSNLALALLRELREYSQWTLVDRLTEEAVRQGELAGHMVERKGD